MDENKSSSSSYRFGSEQAAPKPEGYSKGYDNKKDINEELYTDEDYEKLLVTTTVKTAIKKLGPNRQVYAGEFAKVILETHSEYANNAGTSMKVLLERMYAGGESKSDTNAKRFTPETWLQMVMTLFKPTIPDVNGRIMIIGLSMFDESLKKLLSENNFLVPLIGELKFNIRDYLTKEGLLYYNVVIEGNREDDIDYATGQIDNALVTEKEDKLDRKSFARFLVKLITNIEFKQGSYTMHLYAPWGTGKTTVLNFMKNELTQMKLVGGKPAWHIIDFNAWQNQNLSFPWWSIMNSVYEKVKLHLKWKYRFREWWWRFKTSKLHYLLAVVVISWLLVWFISSLQKQPVNSQSNQTVTTQAQAKPEGASDQPTLDSPNVVISPLKDVFENMDKIIAAVLSVWALILGMSKSVFQGSAKAAENYLSSQEDPMGHFKKRFKSLVTATSPSKIAIFIDDLDRCKSSFVLELLENIQTLFKDTNVLYVIAADKKWIDACYEVEYDKMKPYVSAEGKTIGPLFTEKMFQLSVALPGAPFSIKEKLWYSMLNLNIGADDISANSMDINKAVSVESRERLIREANTKSFSENHATRLKILDMLADKKVLVETEHFLKPYSTFMDLNPRNMKRLLNSYTVNRASSLIAHIDIDLHELVLWTILTLRWPVLAEYLSEHLDDLTNEFTSSKLPVAIEELLRDEEVKTLLSGGHIQKPLRISSIEKCRQLFM